MILPLESRRAQLIFYCRIGDTKVFIFLILFSFKAVEMVFGNIDSLSWVFNANFSGKGCPDSMQALLTCNWSRESSVLSPAESWLVSSNFRRRGLMQTLNYVASLYSCRKSGGLLYLQSCSFSCSPFHPPKQWNE